MKSKFITTGRIVAASICGICQFMLVAGGVIYWSKFAEDYIPQMQSIRGWGAMIGLVSLVWPVYVFAVARNIHTKNQNQK